MKITNTKKAVISICIVFVTITLLSGVLCYLYKQGILIKPSSDEFLAMTEVPKCDILQIQNNIEKDIFDYYYSSNYTMNSPYVVYDPYDFNPLCALVMYDADYESDVTVTIKGKDAFSTIKYVKKISGTHYEIPIIGLYPDTDNKVRITDRMGNYKDFNFVTDALPKDFQQYNLISSIPQKMTKGVTLVTSDNTTSYIAMLDCNGDVRGYISNKNIVRGSSISLLKNGKLLASADEYKYLPNNMYNIYEFNWLGKIFTEYRVPNGVHHCINEMPDGNLLAASNNSDLSSSSSIADSAVILDRENGEIIKEYDFNDIADSKRTTPSFTNQNSLLNAPITNWFQMNSVAYNQSNNSIIISSPIQNQVFCIDKDTSDIKWILSPHYDYDGTSAYMDEYLLTPIGKDFCWSYMQQSISILPDLDNNKDTLEIMLFDTGVNRYAYKKKISKDDIDYSRAVIYSINEKIMTIKQLWQYGTSIEFYSPLAGSAQYIPGTKNYIIYFKNTISEDNDTQNVTSTIIEIGKDNEVVWEMSVTPAKENASHQTYHAIKMPIYINWAYNYTIGDISAKVIGSTMTDNAINKDDTSMPHFISENYSVEFNKIYRRDDRLIINACFLYNNSIPKISKCFVVLTSNDNQFIYQTRGDTMGTLLCSIDLSKLPKGEYAISVFGDVSDSTDYLNAEWTSGHCKTDYKITIY